MRKVSVYGFIVILIILALAGISGCGGGESSGTVPNPPVNPTATPVGNFSERYSIEEINQILDSEGLTWDAEDNPIYRLTDEEFAAMLGEVSDLSSSDNDIYISEKYLNQKQSLPASYCWEWMTPVKHQGGFGSCASFATIGAIEGLLKGRNPGVNMNFSESALHFLNYPHLNNIDDLNDPNQDGRSIQDAAQEAVTQGLALETDAPYGPHGDTEKNGRNEIILQLPVPSGINYIKHLTKDENVVVSEVVVMNSSDTPEAREAIKQALLSGPCSTRFDVSKAFRSYYNSTMYLFDPTTDTNNVTVITQGPVYRSGDHPIFHDMVGGHGVTLIGWDDTQQCWICRNSWGENWGLGGYFKIGYGELGICETVMKFTLASAPTALIEIDHPYRGDLVVKVGCGSPYNPYWIETISDQEGGSEDNIYTNVTLSMGASYMPPNQDNIWFLEVSDVSSGDVGKIKKFEITYNGQTYTSPNPNDSWVSIEDNRTSYAYVPRPQYTTNKVLFSSDRDGENKKFNVYMMNSDGSNQFNFTNGSSGINFRGFGQYRGTIPGGDTIIFHSSRDGNSEIYKMNLDGSNQIRITNNTVTDCYPSFSNDGSKIVYSSVRDSYVEICVMNSDGTNQTLLTNQNAPVEDEIIISACYSPDSNKIVYTSEKDGNKEIYVMNFNGSDKVRLTNNSVSDYYPCYSPDGTKIVFTSTRSGGDGDIFIMNSDSSNPVNLTSDSSDSDWDPTWCPYTNKIYFNTRRDGNDEVYVMNPDGSAQTNLSQNSAIDRFLMKQFFNQPKN